MRQPITPAQFDWIMSIIPVVTMTKDKADWNGPENMERAKAIYKHITGRNPRLGTCITCHLDLYNELRQAVNLPLLGRKVSEGMVEERKRICLSCPIFHPKTMSCGRLGLDALNPIPVDGIEPCGCYLPIKWLFKFATCPADKWPK